MSGASQRNFLTVDPEDSIGVLKGLSSPVRIKILRLLHLNGPMNVNEISAALCALRPNAGSADASLRCGARATFVRYE